MSTRLWRKVADQRPVDQATDDRREHHKPDPKTGQERIQRTTSRSILQMTREQVGDAADHLAEHDRADPRARPHEQRQCDKAPGAAGDRLPHAIRPLLRPTDWAATSVRVESVPPHIL